MTLNLAIANELKPDFTLALVLATESGNLLSSWKVNSVIPGSSEGNIPTM